MPRSRSRSPLSMTRSSTSLVGTEGTALLQHLVDQRCLAVVNVRDDCDVS